MAKTFNEYQIEKVKSAVYDALSKISMELDASEEEMNAAIEWFQTHFYEEMGEE